MPVIACPGCGKQYKVAATAAGQVAKCACGKQFRLGGSETPKVSTSAPASNVAAPIAQPKRAPVIAAAPVATASAAASAKDDFWDDELAIANAPKQPASNAAATASTARTLSGAPVPAETKSKSSDTPKKKKKKKGGIKWGFDWGKVVAGLGSFLIFGGITAAMAMSTGRISIYLSILAVGGLLTALSGLMGEEGIW